MIRVYREPSDEARQRMSLAKSGKPKSPEHRANISKAMKEYWSKIPSRYEHTTMADYLGKTDADNNNKSVPSSTPK